MLTTSDFIDLLKNQKVWPTPRPLTDLLKSVGDSAANMSYEDYLSCFKTKKAAHEMLCTLAFIVFGDISMRFVVDLYASLEFYDTGDTVNTQRFYKVYSDDYGHRMYKVSGFLNPRLCRFEAGIMPKLYQILVCLGGFENLPVSTLFRKYIAKQDPELYEVAKDCYQSQGRAYGSGMSKSLASCTPANVTVESFLALYQTHLLNFLLGDRSLTDVILWYAQKTGPWQKVFPGSQRITGPCLVKLQGQDLYHGDGLFRIMDHQDKKLTWGQLYNTVVNYSIYESLREAGRKPGGKVKGSGTPPKPVAKFPEVKRVDPIQIAKPEVVETPLVIKSQAPSTPEVSDDTVRPMSVSRARDFYSSNYDKPEPPESFLGAVSGDTDVREVVTSDRDEDYEAYVRYLVEPIADVEFEDLRESVDTEASKMGLRGSTKDSAKTSLRRFKVLFETLGDFAKTPLEDLMETLEDMGMERESTRVHHIAQVLNAISKYRNMVAVPEEVEEPVPAPVATPQVQVDLKSVQTRSGKTFEYKAPEGTLSVKEAVEILQALSGHLMPQGTATVVELTGVPGLRRTK